MAKLKSFKQVFTELDFTAPDTKLKVINILDKELDSFVKDKVVRNIKHSPKDTAQLEINFDEQTMPGINSTSFNIELNSNWCPYGNI